MNNTELGINSKSVVLEPQTYAQTNTQAYRYTFFASRALAHRPILIGRWIGMDGWSQRKNQYVGITSIITSFPFVLLYSVRQWGESQFPNIVARVEFSRTCNQRSEACKEAHGIRLPLADMVGILCLQSYQIPILSIGKIMYLNFRLWLTNYLYMLLNWDTYMIYTMVFI